LRNSGALKEGFTYAWVTGSFKNSFTAHAGTTDGRQYICGFLTTPNKHGGYQITAALTSAHYAVTG